MRDLILLAVCCGLAAAFWISSVRRSEDQVMARQALLYQLGAPQTMDDSPERSLLLGRFVQGLRAKPSPETYQKLAPLFLAGNDVKDRKVVALAFNDDSMGRVVGKTVEFFDAQGRSLSPKLWTLGNKLAPWNKPIFEAAASPSLVADGGWLVYRDKSRWAVFRQSGDELRGFISTKEIGIDNDTLLIEGKKAWRWSQGQLEAVPKS
jgi:hypothetical protein